ncbi:hypothetical protein FRC06_001073 [Ceratobasidium sp. 370]|nr:hypothetical protein FRC06_001073 [Ceratobasidium sp. 370]
MLPTPPTQAAPALPNVSSYSSLLTSASPPPEIKSEDESYPFRYSKDQMIRVWKDGGGRGGLGLEVERWPGIVREVGGEPVGVRDMTQEERKLFSMPVNSDPPVRRNNNSLSLAPDRQSTKFGQGIGIGLGPVSPRGMGAPRRRGAGNADDPTSAPFLPRKLSLSSTLLAGSAGSGTPGSPGGPLSSPNTRTRMSTLDGSDAADPWSRGSAAGGTTDPGWSAMGARRRANDSQAARGWGGTAGTPAGGGLGIGRGMSFGSLTNGTASGNGSDHDKISPSASPGPGPASDPDAIASAPEGSTESAPQPGDTSIVNGSETSQSASTANTIYSTNGPGAPAPDPAEDPANIQWSYKDPTGQIQGMYTQWFESGYFNDELLIKRTAIDPDFEPLRDIRRRAAPARPGETYPQIFLSPLAPRAPPNLPPPQSHLLGNNPPLNPSPRLAHLMTGVGDPSNHGPMSAGVSGSPLAHSPALSAAARSTTLDSYLSPSPNSSEGPVAGSVASPALANAAFERKKREDFIQSLRERELAMSVGSPNQQTLGMSSPFGGGFVSNPTVHHPQYSTFGPGNPAIPSTFNSRLVPPPAPIHAPVSNATLMSPPPAKAWATPDEDKPTSLSLREIQQAEARKAEARKAAERVTKAAPPPPTSTGSDESVQAITGSWGLPQVGSRSTAPAPATNGAPAWTKPAVAPVGKKSMKEIQEEEEKRKKAAAAKEAQAVAAAQQAAKRAYAESAKNITAPGSSAGGGAWTTVGAKSSGGSSAAARQPSSVGQPTTNAARVVSGGSGGPGPRSSSSASSTTQASVKPVKPTASSAAVAEDAPVPPSLDFLKWLKEALKGLNGVNVEEFMQMLLSFPLDPSPAVIEIISDSIYANSSTLDGRRFAAEFCQKRKADAAAAHTKINSGSKAPARVSVADVVKTQPKPVQSEWGFKTVQKKAKGGRK